jgi:hypothetical protein
VLSKKLTREELQSVTPSGAQDAAASKVADVPQHYSREHLVLLPYHELVTLVLRWQTCHQQHRLAVTEQINARMDPNLLAGPNALPPPHSGSGAGIAPVGLGASASMGAGGGSSGSGGPGPSEQWMRGTDGSGMRDLAGMATGSAGSGPGAGGVSSSALQQHQLQAMLGQQIGPSPPQPQQQRDSLKTEHDDLEPKQKRQKRAYIPDATQAQLPAHSRVGTDPTDLSDKPPSALAAAAGGLPTPVPNGPLLNRARLPTDDAEAAEQMTMLSPNLTPAVAPGTIGGPAANGDAGGNGNGNGRGVVSSISSPGSSVQGGGGAALHSVAPMSPTRLSPPAMHPVKQTRMSNLSVDRVLGRVTDGASNFPGRLPPSGSLADPRASAGPKITLTSLSDGSNHGDEHGSPADGGGGGGGGAAAGGGGGGGGGGVGGGVGDGVGGAGAGVDSDHQDVDLSSTLQGQLQMHGQLVEGLVPSQSTERCGNCPFLRLLQMQTIILPRQARDKHMKS